MGNTAIPWAEKTWEVTAGCSKISPGCDNCYACRMSATRLDKHPDFGGLAVKTENGYDWRGKVICLPHNIEKPLHWRKPCRVFVDLRSDLFNEDVPFEFIHRVFCIIQSTKRLTYLILTKRPKRVLEFCQWERDRLSEEIDYVWPLPPNVWLGVTAENQEQADARIPLLLATPAAVRFVSCEPLLGPVNVSRWLKINWQCSRCHGLFSGRYQKICPDCGTEEYWSGSHPFNSRKGRGLDWVIAGGESGPNARPMHPDWARSLRDQCVEAGVPYYFKQFGEWAPVTGERRAGDLWLHVNGINKQVCQFKDESGGQDHALLRRVGVKVAGHVLDGREWREYPQA